MGRLRGDLQTRALTVAVAVLDLTDRLPNNSKGWEVGRQLIRAGTSIGANLCEADHALTNADFAHKASIARKESAETAYWLKVIAAARMVDEQHTVNIASEVDEFICILSTMVRKTQAHMDRPGRNR